MIVLDSDHVTALRYPENKSHATLQHRLRNSPDDTLATTVVSVEEQMRGWLALIKRYREVHEQIPAYDRLAKLFEFFRDWRIVRFEERAADEFVRLRKQKIRIGTQDLKVAAIALVNGALLLSANLRDFRRVPNLRVESWLE